MNAAALIIVAIHLLGKTPDNISRRDYEVLKTNIGTKSCSENNGTCVATVVTEATKAVKADRKSRKEGAK
jgi:hypothetical protein